MILNTYFYIFIILFACCFFLSLVTCAAHGCAIQLTTGYLIPTPSIHYTQGFVVKKKHISTLRVCQKHTDHV